MPNWFDVGSALVGAGSGLIGSIDRAKTEKEQASFKRAIEKGGLLKEGIDVAKNPDTGEYEVKKVGGSSHDLDKELKALQLEKARGELHPEVLSPQSRMAKLGAAEKSHLDQTKNALTGIAQMADALKSGVSTVSLVGDNPFTKAATTFENAIGRLESGGAISKDEGARYRGMAPKTFDPPELKIQKLKDLQADMNSRLATLGFKPEEAGKPYNFEGYSLPQKGLLETAKGAVANVPNPFVSKGGLLPTAQAGSKPAMHTKESLSAMTDEQLKALLKGQ